MAIVSYETANGQSVLIEVRDEGYGFDRVGRKDGISQASERLEDALDTVTPAATSVIDRLRKTTSPPEEISVTFGIKLGAKAGALIACVDSEANFSVTVTWKK